MLQVVISFFLIISTASSSWQKKGKAKTEKTKDSNIGLSKQIQRSVRQLSEKDFTRSTCQNQLSRINQWDQELQLSSRVGGGSMDSIDNMMRINRESKGTLRSCVTQITNTIAQVEHPVSRTSWYNQHLAEREYEKDFERYPDLKKQFNNEIEKAFNNLRRFQSATSDSGGGPQERGSSGVEDTHDSIYLITRLHPHLQDPTLPERYNTHLLQLREAKACTPKKTKACHESLMRQLAQDSGENLKSHCQKALKEGQVCCSNPSRNCGDFAFAKDIADTFRKNSPGLLQALGNLQRIKGNAAEACKLSQLGSVLGPLGNLQLDSCKKAEEGCRETCQSRLDQFKKEFKQCYGIGEEESIKEVMAKAQSEDQDEEDPRYQCYEQLAELGEAYKQITRESQYSLKEDSDDKELVSCQGEILKYTPGQQAYNGGGGMNPTEQMAVNMCYQQLDPTAAVNPPVLPPTVPGGVGPTTGVSGFTGGRANNNTSLPPVPGDEGIGAYAGPIDDDTDFITGTGTPPANKVGFGGNISEGGGPGGGSDGLGGGGLPGGGSSDDEGERSLAGGKGKSKDLPFYSGDPGRGKSDGNWDAEDRKWYADKKRAEGLKKLPSRYLTMDEKDLVKMYSKPGKHESIFERASFALHWFCRNYGCVGYDEAMGIPEYARKGRPKGAFLMNFFLQPEFLKRLSP